MWSGPRNVSTALMYSFAQRSDTVVVDEPLYGHYLRASGAQHPGRDEVIAAMDNDGRRVMRGLATDPSTSPVVFAKQMAHHFVELDPALLKGMDHFLLIRDPCEMLPSLIEVLGTVTLRDTGLPDQTRLLDYLVEGGLDPFTVDSKDLLLDPEHLLAAVCERLGLTFEPAMLRWRAGARPEDGVWASWWYANVHRSTGFQLWRPTERTVREEDQPLLQECIKHYDRLREYSIEV
jgi:hypothetical protein